ncbi:aminopeptidase N [Microlunatus flavus]|uniref:Aminopeptidase N n=1 Tax=Microlunatus flavus TaxID=1036181 RepID=A0A1H9KCC7_9ACTN|nr:aminopeptidase N [Microlunatus flavus]SEQ96732.1 aminopeptidase N [Microlunatus flavus]
MSAGADGRTSLTRTEAEARAAALSVDSVEVALDLTDPSLPTFGSRAVIRFSSSVDATFVDFAGDELVSATLNGRPLDLGSWRRARIPLTGLGADNVLEVEGRMGYSSDGEGLHRHVDPADGRTYLYAMSFLDAAPRWFACFDQPDLKARCTFEVEAPEHWTVLGNGPSETLGPGRWRIVAPHPLSTYFTTLVAGPYASVHGEHDGIPLGLHIRASLRSELEAQAEDMLAVTAASFDYYHRLFGIRYPFGEYHQAFVPDFNAGAMENPGCVTFRDSYVPRGRITHAEQGTRAGTIAHEMAHQWFGDLVTMRWWDDLWLNESFAEYLAHRCCTEATPYALWTEFGIARKDWGSVADQSPSTHPVAGNAAPDAAAALQNFDGISYAKGAAVLRQLATYVGDEVFLAGLRDHISGHAYGNATFADLVGSWTRAGAQDLPSWAQAWLRTSGMDTLDVEHADEGVRLVATPPPGQPVRPHTVQVGLVDEAGAVTVLDPVTVGTDPAVVPVAGPAVLVTPDATDVAWAKLRFGPDGWERVAAALPGLTDETASVGIWNAVRDAVRDAGLDPRRALALVESSLPAQRSEVVWDSVLTFARTQLAATYAPVEERAARARRVRAVAWTLVDGAQPASDRQLVAFRQAVRLETDPSRLRAWFDGSALPSGLALDPELVWAVVERWCALQTGTGLLEEALSRDPSASGQVHAARARAARPDPEAKAAAWRLLVEPSTAGAYELYATGDGFWAVGQEELTQAYVPRWFAEIGRTARFREGWALGQVATQSFPRTAATPEALRLADSALRGDLAAQMRRAVVDGTDKLRRAVASLDRWA